MLAEDLKPNRLKQAKLAIGDLISELEGDRIGIIAFAGTCVLKCPLTQDYSFARMALTEMTPRASPRAVQKSATRSAWRLTAFSMSKIRISKILS